MASTRKRDDGYSRPLPPSDNSPSYSSRPPDQAQTGRPSRSGKSKGQSQNKNQSNDVPTDVPPTQQSLVAPPMQSPTYSQYLKTLDTTTLGSGPEPSSRRAMEPPARPPENRAPPVTMAPPSGYHSTAWRNEPVRRDVEPETRSRGDQVSPRVVVVLVFVILTNNAPGSIQFMRTDELLSRSPRAPPTHLVDPLRMTFLSKLKLESPSRLKSTLRMETEGSPPTSDIRVSQAPMQWYERTHLHLNLTILPNPNSMSNHLPGILYQRPL
jgi:hypothetical protein